MPAEPLQPIPAPSALRSAFRSAAASVAVVSALFCLAVGARLALNQARLAERDPLNAPALIEMRRQYAEAPDNEALKTRIRQEDARARQDYFAGQERAGTGARLLLGGVLALLLGLVMMSLFRDDAPDVTRFGPPPSDWARRRTQRRGLAAGALLLLAIAALLACMSRRDARDPALNPNPNPNPNPNLNPNYDYNLLTLQFCQASPRAVNHEQGTR